MKFICNKKDFQDAVLKVSNVVSEKSTIPSLEGIKLKLDNSSLELTGYDLEIGIKKNIEVQSDDSGSFILNAKFLSDMIRKMPNENVTFEISENYQVTVTSGSTTFNLFAMSAEDYPELPGKTESEKLCVPQPVLKNMITQTIFACSESDIKPILKGELFEVENSGLTLVAIDGYRLAVRYEPIKEDKNISFVVPSKALSEVAKILTDNEEDIASLYLSAKHIIFEINGYMVYSRLLEGEFHPYRSAIPATSSTEVIVDRKELLTVLDRVSLLINERTPAPVRCYFENNKLKVNCSTTLGKINDEVNAEISGNVIEIGFKCKFLIDPLKAITDDRVKLQMGGSLLPMKIVPCDGDKYTYLVLPVRLPKEN